MCQSLTTGQNLQYPTCNTVSIFYNVYKFNKFGKILLIVNSMRKMAANEVVNECWSGKTLHHSTESRFHGCVKCDYLEERLPRTLQVRCK
jgi:hypothetical protein